MSLPTEPYTLITRTGVRFTVVEQFRATYLQEWHFDAVDDGLSNLNVPILIRLLGDHNTAALQRALDDLVARHEALRTRLVRTDSGIVQKVPSRDHVELASYGPSDTAHQSTAQVLQMARTVLAAPFHVRGGQLTRAAIIPADTGETILIINTHHAICDAWSAGIVYRDLIELYRARCANRPPRLPRPEVQLGDYAHWERDARDVPPPKYWREQLNSPHPRLRIGVGTQADRRPAEIRVRRLPPLPARTVGSLRMLATKLDTTLPRLLAAVVIGSVRHYADDTMTVGLFNSNRHRPELRHAVGDFSNQLPIRLDVPGQYALADLVRRFDECATDAYDNQVPLAAIASLLRNDPDRVTGPLFDIRVNYVPHLSINGDADADDSIERLQLQPIEQRYVIDRWWTGAATVDYRQTERPDGGLELSLHVNVNSLSREQIYDLGTRFTRLLEAFCANPDVTVP